MIPVLLSILLAAAAILPAKDQDPQRFTVRPVDLLIQEARSATPPTMPAPRLRPDLVELTKLDPTLRLDIRYATRDNFLGAPVYK